MSVLGLIPGWKIPLVSDTGTNANLVDVRDLLEHNVNKDAVENNEWERRYI